jgi:hypothetical protein
LTVVSDSLLAAPSLPLINELHCLVAWLELLLDLADVNDNGDIC